MQVCIGVGTGDRGKGRRFMLRKSFSNLGKLDGPGGKGKPGKRQWEKHSEWSSVLYMRKYFHFFQWF